MNARDAKRFEVKRGRAGTGRGLFARLPMRKGQFILEYTGKKIPTTFADTLESRYLFEVSKKWTIDAEGESNTARFINHSCEPNTEAVIEEDEDGEERIMIYAVRGIAAGEELTIDYDDEYFDEFIKPMGCKCPAKVHRS